MKMCNFEFCVIYHHFFLYNSLPGHFHFGKPVSFGLIDPIYFEIELDQIKPHFFISDFDTYVE